MNLNKRDRAWRLSYGFNLPLDSYMSLVNSHHLLGTSFPHLKISTLNSLILESHIPLKSKLTASNTSKI